MSSLFVEGAVPGAFRDFHWKLQGVKALASVTTKALGETHAADHDEDVGRVEMVLQRLVADLQELDNQLDRLLMNAPE